jgi:hypothetical protein
MAQDGYFKLVLATGGDQGRFVHGGNHHVPGALQDELPCPNQ